MISNTTTATPPPRTTTHGLNDVRDDSDKAKYKKALLKKLRWQIVASREKKRNTTTNEVIDAKKKKEVSNEDVVEKTLFNLETRLGISRDSEEVKACFRVANDLDLSSSKKKKKKKEKSKRGGGQLEEDVTPLSKKQKKDFIVDDGKATQTFHRLALTLAKEETNDEMMMKHEAERCVREVLLRVNRFDSFRTCSAQWSLATMCANMVKRRKNGFVDYNDGFREQSMLLRENLARRFKELAEKADARACATNLWFLAQTSGTMSGEKSESFSASIKAAIKGLRACEEDKISSQDGANALWGIAKLRVKSSLKSEEIESVVAKLAERVVVAAAAAAEMSGSTNSKSNNSKEVSSAMWALATMHVDGIILSGGSSSAKSSSKSSDGLDATILRVAKVVKKAFQKESKNNAIKTSWSESRVVANCVWSCAKLFANALLAKDTRKVLRETMEIALENENLWQHLEPRAFATLLSAATTIHDASSSSSSYSSLRRRVLLKRALDCFEDTSTHGRDVTPADVCDLCEFIEAFTTTTTTKKKSSEDNKLLEEADFEDRVMKIVTDISKTCDWRASGRLLSSAEALNVDARAKKRLLSSGVEAIKIMELDRFNVDEATAETLSRHIEEQLKSKSTKQRRVLIANCESRSEGKLRQTVEKFGHRFETWQRFSCNDDTENENASRNDTMRTNARPWPTVSERKCDYAFVRACADKEALLFLMTAVATRVKVGGEVFVSGSRSEGFLNAFDAFNKDLYEHPRRVPGHTTIAHSPNSEEAKKSEKRLRVCVHRQIDSNVKLFFGGGGGSSVVEAKEWTTYPGFFAKGGLDIMTLFLLDSILEEDPEKSSPSSSPRLKKGICSDKTKRVMDFCCGSGVIGYALRNALGNEKTKKKVKLTMLDADAYLLSDGFPQKTTKPSFELILTNPPVHYNAKPDFRVLGNMLTELPNVLKKEKKGGACFCVCQRYVPLESVAQYYNNKTTTKIDLKIHAKNDRFCVWKIVICNKV
ncbi:unnamed protein product [Bathycoccus prasinos]